MPALDSGTAQQVLAGLAGQSAFVASTAPLKIRLMVSTPTAAVPGTELSGAGYTAGGLTLAFAAPATTADGALMLSTGTPSWTNGGGAAWVLYGFELWDSAGTPIRKWYGVWDDAPITIGPGSPFSLAASAIGLQFPLWP